MATDRQGREIAEAGEPMLDATDTAILSALRTAVMGPARLSRRCSISEPTAARRARLLVGRGLLYADMRGFFEVTEAGLAALGDATPAEVGAPRDRQRRSFPRGGGARRGGQRRR